MVRIYRERLWDFGELWGGRWVAGDIPGWTAATLGSALYQTRYLSNSGRLFFNSSDALVPADVNGEEDVYEYEPSGAAGCQASLANPEHRRDRRRLRRVDLGGQLLRRIGVHGRKRIGRGCLLPNGVAPLPARL